MNRRKLHHLSQSRLPVGRRPPSQTVSLMRLCLWLVLVLPFAGLGQQQQQELCETLRSYGSHQ